MCFVNSDHGSSGFGIGVPISSIRSLSVWVSVETGEMVRTGEAGGHGVRIQFGEIWRIDDGRIKNEAVSVGQRLASDMRQSSHPEGYFVFSKDPICIEMI